MTIGLIAGSQLPRKEGVSYFADPKVLWSALLWLVYLEALVAHKFFGRPARRFAVGVIAAFVFLLLTFGLTNKLSPLHQNSPSPATNSAAAITMPAPAASHPLATLKGSESGSLVIAHERCRHRPEPPRRRPWNCGNGLPLPNQKFLMR